jgi:Uma2 family endonuclease
MQKPLVQLTSSEKEPELITGRELLSMGDIGPCELVEGKIVAMSPTKPVHGHYEYRIAKAIGDFAEAHQLGEVQVGEVGIYTARNPDTVRGADAVFISYERLDQTTAGDYLDVAPELVVEIMSPNDRWSEVRKKLQEYFAIGVKAVLVVEPEEKVISVYRSRTAVTELGEGDTLVIEDVLPGFAVPVSTLFARSR